MISKHWLIAIVLVSSVARAEIFIIPEQPKNILTVPLACPPSLPRVVFQVDLKRDKTTPFSSSVSIEGRYDKASQRPSFTILKDKDLVRMVCNYRATCRAEYLADPRRADEETKVCEMAPGRMIFQSSKPLPFFAQADFDRPVEISIRTFNSKMYGLARGQGHYLEYNADINYFDLIDLTQDLTAMNDWWGDQCDKQVDPKAVATLSEQCEMIVGVYPFQYIQQAACCAELPKELPGNLPSRTISLPPIEGIPVNNRTPVALPTTTVRP